MTSQTIGSARCGDASLQSSNKENEGMVQTNMKAGLTTIKQNKSTNRKEKSEVLLAHSRVRLQSGQKLVTYVD